MNKHIITFVKNNPKVSSVVYSLVRKFWKAEARLLNYNFPEDSSLATMNYEKVLMFNQNRPYGPKRKICYAPFNNLHFQINGDVSACSYNYNYIIGNVINSSIKDIWYGEKANEFRETLSNYNLDKCNSCKNVFESGNYTSFPALKYDMFSSDNVQMPTQMSFELSDLCNYECVMCNEEFSSLIRKNRANLLPKKYVYPERFFDELKEFIPQLKIATFIGGEPLLIKSYFRIWEDILKLNNKCRIHIQTNASIITPRFEEMLESGQFDVGISLDGATKDTFEKIRINSNFEEVQKNVLIYKDFMDRGKVMLNINFCPLTLNWQEIPLMLDYANKLQIPFKIVNLENPVNLSLQSKNERYLDMVIDNLSKATYSNSVNIIEKRNIEAFRNFINQLNYFKKQAVERELFYNEIKNQIDVKVKEIFLTTPLLVNSTNEYRKKVSDEIYDYINNLNIDNHLKLRVKFRLYDTLCRLNFSINQKLIDDYDYGIRVLKKNVHEFILLESEEQND